MKPEQERRAMELLPQIVEMEKALEAGIAKIIEGLPTRPIPLFYLLLDSDTVRPAVELCEALDGKTDTLWAKRPHETTQDEDLIRCVAIRRFLSFKTALDPLADRIGGRSFEFDGHPNYRFSTEVSDTHDDHIQQTLIISLTPDYTAD